MNGLGKLDRREGGAQAPSVSDVAAGACGVSSSVARASTLALTSLCGVSSGPLHTRATPPSA